MEFDVLYMDFDVLYIEFDGFLCTLHRIQWISMYFTSNSMDFDVKYMEFDVYKIKFGIKYIKYHT